MEKFYKTAFADEGHLLVLFYEPRPEDYTIWYFMGSAAEAVIDEEAAEILLDYLDKYYYYGNLNSGEYFAEAFTKAADRIMSVTMDPRIFWALIAAGLALVIVLAVRFALKRRRAKLRREQELPTTLADILGKKARKPEKPAELEHAEKKRWRGFDLKRIAFWLRNCFTICVVAVAVGVFNVVIRGTSLLSVFIVGLTMFSVPAFVVRTIHSHALPGKGSDDSLRILLAEVFLAPFRWFTWKNVKPLLFSILPFILLVIFLGITFFLLYQDGTFGVTRRLGLPPVA
jgi:hypothetical protein